jgi:mannitol/fructose-specific phosphotransferase system IIA component (Ntr-type)
MRLRDVIPEERIIPELRATTKPDVLEEMVRALVDTQCLDAADADSMVDALLAREAIGSTGIGHGLAIAHAKHPKVRRLLAAYGHSTAGIEYGALDGRPVHCVFLLTWPDGVIGPHLEAIAEISKLLKITGVLDSLRHASRRSEIARLLEEASPGDNG